MVTDIEMKEFSESAPFNNMLYRIYKFINGEKMPPFKLVLTPTDRCNLNCIFCPNYVARKAGRFKKEDELTDEEWLKFVREAIKMGVNDWLILGGGEPWLRNELIIKILREVKQKIKIPYFEIFTNGTLFEAEEIKTLVELEPTRITVSVHALGEEYVELTGSSKEMFSKVVENLKLLKLEKEKNKKTRPQIQINMVINRKNYTKILEMVNFAKEVGANILALHPMRGYEETREVISPLILPPEKFPELKDYIEKGKKISEQFGILLDTTPLEPFMPMEKNESLGVDRKLILENIFKLRCFEPWYSMVINSDGLVGRCTAFIIRDEPLNIKNMSLEEIWYSDYFNQVRKNVVEGKMMVGCSQCGLMSTTATLKRAFSHMEDWMEGNITLKQLREILRGLSTV
jgi:MoaA/NifB/PqqE/SkfB family radical SAM enzyme